MIDTILNRIGKNVPTQKKKIEKFFAEYPDARGELDSFLGRYRPFMQKNSISLETVVDSYLELVNQMMHSRLEFLRTGQYPMKSQQVAYNDIYMNNDTMQQYMLGLALSYFLWRHQFQLFIFYRKNVQKAVNGTRFLEVGCGHGLLLVELLSRMSEQAVVDVVDISGQSLVMTQNLLHASFPGDNRSRFFHSDILNFKAELTYDFITIGEVLEHVENPRLLLSKLAGLLAADGRIFVTTCANCPAIDHVYHFQDVQQIVNTIDDAGLEVVDEIIAPSEKKDPEYLKKNRVDISYAAILKRKAIQ